MTAWWWPGPMGECSHSHRVSPVMYDGQERGTAEEAAHSRHTATENARLPHRGIPGIADTFVHSYIPTYHHLGLVHQATETSGGKIG